MRALLLLLVASTVLGILPAAPVLAQDTAVDPGAATRLESPSRPNGSPQAQERRRRRLRRFLETLPPEERARYEARIAALRDGRSRYDSLSEQEKSKLRDEGRALFQELRMRGREAREELRALPPEERQQLREKLRRFRELSEEEQQELRARYRMLRERPVEDQERLRENAERFREMTPEKRERLREQRRRLREMSPEQRQQLREQLRGRRTRGASPDQK